VGKPVPSHRASPSSGHCLPQHPRNDCLHVAKIARIVHSVIKELAARSAIWPIIGLPFTTLRVSEDEEEDLGIGADFTAVQQQKQPGKRDSRFSPELEENFLCQVTATFMLLVKLGFRSTLNEDWNVRVRGMDPLTEKTAPAWWTLAQDQIIRDFPGNDFPEIEQVVFAGKTVGQLGTRNKAIKKLENAFIHHTWKFFDLAPPKSPAAVDKSQTAARTWRTPPATKGV
jgi:hypothetical protein